MAEEVASITVGQRLGKYLLTEKLGEGGMGMVFGGVHETLGREVAVKVLRGEFATNENVVQRFEQEAQAVSRIGHANIVAIYDFGRLADNSLYYVMERIRGETLTQRMHSSTPLGPEESVSIIGQICRALHATHTRGIVHRDLKPDNILLQPSKSTTGMPHVKLVDFGVAKMRQMAQDEQPVGPNLTKSGMLLGTPTYMAPEQITSSGTVDGRADIYSLGAILYEILTGQPPFGRGELLTILTKHVKEAVVPPSKRSPERAISPALDAFVVKALAKRPGERQADPNAFITELETAWGVLRTRTTPSMQTIDPKILDNSALRQAPPPSSKKWILGAVAGLLVVGGGAGAVVALKGRGGTTNTTTTGSPTKKAPIKLAPESPQQIEANKILSAALAGDALGRRAAVEAMADVGDRGAMDQVITALGDDNPEIRRAAANAAIAIGKPDDTGLRQALVDAAARSGGAVAVDIAAARFNMGDAAAQEDLERALEMRDPTARLRAAVALAHGMPGKPGKLPAGLLRQAIAAAPPTTRRSLRWAAFVQLYNAGDAAFAAELKTALDGKDPIAKLDAAQTLARAKDPAGMVALAALAAEAPDPVDRVDAAAVQAELGDVGALDSLALALTSPQPTVRARAATSLGRLAPSLPDQATLEKQLAPVLKDSEPGPRIAAAAALLAVKPAGPPTTR